MVNMNLKVLSGDQVDEIIFSQMLNLDKKCFSEEYSLSSEYIRTLYKNSKEGLFCLVDNNTCVGYMHCIFITEDQKQEYVNGGDCRNLINIGPVVGDNILYILSIAVAEKYRGTGVLKLILKDFSKWILDCKVRGIKIKFCFAEAISNGGVRVCNEMGLVPIDDQKLDSNNHGFYYSPDNLEEYSHKMKK